MKIYECNRCGRRYKWKNSLSCHQRDECGQRPKYFCKFCNYMTKVRSNLLRHERSHNYQLEKQKYYEIVENEEI